MKKCLSFLVICFMVMFTMAACTGSNKEVGFELASAGKVEYYIGEELDTSGVKLNAKLKNGKKKELDISLVTIDTSNVDMNTVGEYTVVISYKEYQDVSYTVNVQKKENGFTLVSAGKVDYYVGDTLDFSGLVLNKTFEIGDNEPLDTSLVTIFTGDVNMNAVGQYTITISYKEYDNVEYTINVSKREDGFQLVSPGKVEYAVGDTLDFSAVQLKATYAEGGEEPLSVNKVNFNTQAVDMSQSGEYTVAITYKGFDAITYNVKVYEYRSMTLEYDSIDKNAVINNSGNEVHANHSFREVYGVGDELSTKGLVVRIVRACGDNVEEFVVNNYSVSNFDSSFAGSKTLTVSYEYSTGKSLTSQATVFVVDEDPSVVNNVFQTRVDKDYAGVIGAKVEGFNTFTTIQQALDFLADTPDTAYKLLVITEGLYTEKIELTLPNLIILGEGTDKTTIEWNSIYGQEDFTGMEDPDETEIRYGHRTDTTATVAIRETATNCIIEGLTISNYWNSQERYDEAGLGIERAIALLVQADEVIVRDCAVLGVQDTLELFKGRQYFERTYISGYTDFIFGTNNTTYFTDCTIHVINTVKNTTEQGGAGAVITAFKGWNRGEGDNVVYGAIFDGCKFTGDEELLEGWTALGRPWFKYASVAFVNSEMGAHISKEGYGVGVKRPRYSAMGGHQPTLNTVNFVEYNNYGDGAINEAVAGMRMLELLEMGDYTDFYKIYTINNGNISYLTAWNPDNVYVGGDDKVYYFFDNNKSWTGESHTFDTTTTIPQGTTYQWGDLLISAENGNIGWDSNSGLLNMKKDAFIKFTVPARTSVTVETYDDATHRYNAYTINGVATSSSNMFARYFENETEVIILSTHDLYLRSIVLDMNAPIPADPTLNEITVEGLKTDYEVGNTPNLTEVVVKGYYSDSAIVVLTDYVVDDSKVNIDSDGKYEIVFSKDDVSLSLYVTYTDPNKEEAIVERTYLDFSSTAGFAEVETNEKVVLDLDVRHFNGAEYQIKGTVSFKVKAGTIVTVVPYNNPQYVAYTLGVQGEADLETLTTTTSKIFDEDCTVVYTGLDNNYLVSIQITCAITKGKYVFGGCPDAGDVTEIVAINVQEKGVSMIIEGTTGYHSGGVQLGQDSKISFVMPALATVEIKGYDTNYGQLLVYLDGQLIEMGANAIYTLQTGSKYGIVVIQAKNVGTEDEPAYNKSYLSYVNVVTGKWIEEDVKVTFGSEGNYHQGVEGFDFSTIKIGDNGADNAQVKEGYIRFAVRAGATVTIKGYPKYTNYVLKDEVLTSGDITDEIYTYEAQRDVILTITPGNNNYFYYIEVSYDSAQ